MKKVKQFVKQNDSNYGFLGKNGLNSYISQRSSGGEQRFRKPPVVGSTPTAGSMDIE